MYSPIRREPLRSSADALALSEGLEHSVSRRLAIELPVMPGQVISGKYQVIQRIGAGGMGLVFSAMHLDLGERVALKFLRREALAHPELVQRFATEARAAARIRSEHVARVFDVGQLGTGVPFIVMEYLAGEDLSEVLADRGALPIELAVDYTLEVCEGLASAHAKGIIHRDIKPENLFLARGGPAHGVIKVLDFGVSKLSLESSAVPGERHFIQTTLPVGSPAYMSPEQIRDSGEVDRRTDIWSLGCALFELLTGKVPFDAPTLVQLGAAILEQEPVPLRRELPEAPPELEALIARCLDKDPNGRFADVAELARALSPFASQRARIYAERCSFLLPEAERLLEYERLLHRDSVPSLTRDPSMTAPAIRDAGLRQRGRIRRLRSSFWFMAALAAFGASYVIGIQTRSSAVPAATTELPRPAVTQAPPSATPARASVGSSAAQATAIDPSAAPTRTSNSVSTSAARARPRVDRTPRPRVDRAAATASALTPSGVPGSPKPERVFGQARDESFDVGY
jgi:eukaryotic-like serine/threonine-protein kinase